MSPEEELRAAGATGSVPPVASGEARRRVSAPRVAGIVVILGAAVLAFFLLGGAGTSASPVTESGFSPYVDVTATPLYAFENSAGDDPSDPVLGFVVSSTASPCTPSWGTAYSLDGAAASLDLDRRVARVQQLGGDVTISFGGAANSELAIGCTDPTSLVAAYRSVVDRYSADTIDLDVEGAPSSAPAVAARRATALAALQADEQQAGRPLAVWLTLPVGPGGLSSDGLTVLDAALAAHVRLAGVNAMVMDYGDSLPAGRTMGVQAELSLTAVQQQVRSAYAAAGTSLSDLQAWQLLGATPMIGQNDTPGEVFDLADARQLVDFARQHHLRRISMWSANRDQGCGPNYPDVTMVSDQCSGVTQSVGGFASVFHRFVSAGAPAVAVPGGAGTSSPSATDDASDAAAVDDPATSPYAIWDDEQGYVQGTKTVWHHNVYQAKWYTQGDQPDVPVVDASQTPWTLIGPVLPGEHPVPLPTMRPGTYPDWNAKAVYVAGSRVLHDGVGYRAKWWTQGDLPGAILDSPYDSPWQLLTTG